MITLLLIIIAIALLPTAFEVFTYIFVIACELGLLVAILAGATWLVFS